MAMPFPTGCDNNKQRHQFCSRMKEKLILLHNLVVKWKETGLTLDEWTNGGVPNPREADETGESVQLPANLKVALPYKAQIDETEFRQFLQWWDPRMERLMTELGVQRKAVEMQDYRQDTEFEVGFDELPVTYD